MSSFEDERDDWFAKRRANERAAKIARETAMRALDAAMPTLPDRARPIVEVSNAITGERFFRNFQKGPLT